MPDLVIRVPWRILEYRYQSRGVRISRPVFKQRHTRLQLYWVQLGLLDTVSVSASANAAGDLSLVRFQQLLK